MSRGTQGSTVKEPYMPSEYAVRRPTRFSVCRIRRVFFDSWSGRRSLCKRDVCRGGKGFFGRREVSTRLLIMSSA